MTKMTESDTIGDGADTFSHYPHEWMDTDSFSAGAYRRAMVKKLLGKRVGRLLDVGCGPIFPNYAMADCADEDVALDWKPAVVGVPPPNVQILAGDFIEADLDAASFDAIVAIDVLEYVLLEIENEFAARCAALLKPQGLLVVSVPHRGTFAMMDPYEMRPRFHRLLSRVGLYSKTHNGTCDIRKGHKHYTQGELKQLFCSV